MVEPQRWGRSGVEGSKKVTDLTVDQVVERCRKHWRESGISEAAVDEMSTELRSHLEDATAAGKPIEVVTGREVDEFAEEWAVAYLGPQAPRNAQPSEPVKNETPPSLPKTDSRSAGWALWTGILVMVALVALVAIFAPKETSDEQAVWVAVWFISAAILAVGELLTAGFFLLPFAVGAAAAGVLALIGIAPALQVVTFVVISVGSLWLLQQFAKKDRHGELIAVGAARYTGAVALVLEPVSKFEAGWVKMGSEDWRATTDRDDVIEANTEVRVIEVRGARLVVEPINK
jgi:membrane protein implicated in regulation of membrane protease activity